MRRRSHGHLGTYPISQVTRWARQLASALNVMRDASIIHGDLSPRNILATTTSSGQASSGSGSSTSSGNPWDCDLVVADLGGGIYRTRSIARTPNPYMPTGAHVPLEQETHGELVSHTTDMWAYGVCLHLIATRTWLDPDEPLTKGFYTDLAKTRTLEADLNEQLLLLYGDAGEDGRHVAAIAKVISHCLVIAPTDRWPASRVLHELNNSIQGMSTCTHACDNDDCPLYRVKSTCMFW